MIYYVILSLESLVRTEWSASRLLSEAAEGEEAVGGLDICCHLLAHSSQFSTKQMCRHRTYHSNEWPNADTQLLQHYLHFSSEL